MNPFYYVIAHEIKLFYNCPMKVSSRNIQSGIVEKVLSFPDTSSHHFISLKASLNIALFDSILCENAFSFLVGKRIRLVTLRPILSPHRRNVW